MRIQENDMLKPVQFGNSYEICLPDVRDDIARRFKAANPDATRIIAIDDPEVQDLWEGDDSTQGVLTLDDWNDISVLTNNPPHKTAKNFLLVKAALEYLQKHCGLPEEFVEKTLEFAPKFNDEHVRISHRD